MGVYVPEIAAQTLFSVTPGVIESQVVGVLGGLAKYMAFFGATITNLVLYGLLGVLLYRYHERMGKKAYPLKWLTNSLTAYLLILFISVLLVNTTEVLTQSIPIQIMALYLLFPNMVYGLALTFLYSRVPTLSLVWGKAASTEVNYRRRTIIRSAAAVGAASVILFYGINLLLPKKGRLDPETFSQSTAFTPSSATAFTDPMLASLIASEVTTNDLFYTVDVNVVPPKVDAHGWKLTVKGLVENPISLSYEELKALPAVETYNTLECISNETGGDLTSTAKWRGVKLKDIIGRTKVKPETKYIVFRCSDGYDVGIPFERGLFDGTLLVYEMNGVALPVEHGFPLRAVVPGLYGMMNAKWIKEIEFVNKVHEGFWQRRGWANNAEYQTHSTIVLPGESEVRKRFPGLKPFRVYLGSRVPVAGIAFAGDRGIAKVEISSDEGKTWSQAGIRNPLSENTWVLWAVEWNPTTKGRYRLMVRATDKKGSVQIATIQEPFPKGATGYHYVDIAVEDPA